MRPIRLLLPCLAVTAVVGGSLACAEPPTQPSGIPPSAGQPFDRGSVRGSGINFDRVALTDVVDYFRDATGANFVVDWKALEAAGIDRTTPVTLRLRGVTLGIALKKTLDAAAPGQLAFYVDQNIVQITTLALADDRMVTRVYPVADLIQEVPDFTGPNMDLAQSTGGGGKSGGSGGGGGGGSSGSVFGGGASTTNNNKTKTMAEKAADLIDLIQSTVRPDVWDVNGGKAAIRYTAGRIVVTAPLAVQELIGGR